ncbi:MAG: hypothetical protein Q4C56_06845 [Peptococcaceae bacterium]|nr:hypothetical protein [Peptococcaceae bacterium]
MMPRNDLRDALKDITLYVKQPTESLNGAIDRAPFAVDLMGNRELVDSLESIADSLQRILWLLEDRM